MCKSIVLINQAFSYLMSDIAYAFVEQYDEVVLLGGWPIKGVKTDRIMVYKKQSSVKRLWTWLAATIQVWWKIVRKYKNYELFIVSNPPFAPLLPLILKNKFSLLIFDIYPDVLVNQQILKDSNFIIKWWKKANRKVFAKAECVFTISEGMKKCLCQYTESDNIKVVPLWPDQNNNQRVEKDDNQFIKDHHLEGKFIVLYSGNLGSTHRMDVLVDVAQKVKNVVFLIVGEGAKKKQILDRVEKERCENVLVLPYQPLAKFSQVLSAADIAVVTLDMRATQMSAPSKTFNIMAVGTPIMGIASSESELGRMIKKYDMGRCFLPDDIYGMADFVCEMKENSALKNRLGQNALAASLHFTKENAKIFTMGNQKGNISVI